MGKVPLLIKGADVPRSAGEEGMRRLIERAVKEQYDKMTAAEFEQMPPERKTALVDDLQESPEDPAARRRMLDYLDKRFRSIVLTAADDLYVQVLEQRGEDVAALLPYQRFEISDFGHVRLEDLAVRWTALGQRDADPVQIRAAALDLCEKVQSLLAVAGMPHTPWLLVVILEHEGSPDATIAAKTGDYGHLYHAVITTRLSQSQFKRFSLNGKFSYIAELAYHLYRQNRATLSDTAARDFHADYCGRFDLTLDYEKVRDDLVEIRILRLDGDQLAFRHKYVFSFFVAWWLSRNIHRSEAEGTVRTLCTRLHHDVSANVLVFLSHLSDNPVVREHMLSAAKGLFSNAKAADMDGDIRSLNRLPGVEGFFRLPPTAPEVNRKLLQDAADQQRLAQRDAHTQDGRLVQIVPDDEPSQEKAAEAVQEFHANLRQIRASVRTIAILGQVLRNKAQSAEGPEKLALMEEVLAVGRRLLGHIYGLLSDLPLMVRDIRRRLMPAMVASAKAQKAAKQKKERARVDGRSAEPPCDEGPIKLTREEVRKVRDDAAVLANRFWFDMYWLASFATVKRLGTAVGAKDLDTTLARVLASDGSIPNQLVEFATRLLRRGKHVPADDLVRLHKKLAAADNKVPRVVLEALAWQRLLMFETDIAQAQQICQAMGIRVPVKSLDSSRKKFTPRKGGKSAR